MDDLINLILDVASMSPSDVETALSDLGVGPWIGPVGSHAGMIRPERGPSGPIVRCAISDDGRLWRNSTQLDATERDTTTSRGRADCDRRLLVHLLREEVTRG